MDPPELASEPAPGYVRRGEIHASRVGGSKGEVPCRPLARRI